MILQTDRLTVRRFDLEDAGFILRLLNEPSFIENVADRGIRNLHDARRYLSDVLIASYAKHGFGFWRVGLKDHDVPIGLAGLVKRECLEDVDLGYALFPEHCGQGYALEVAAATMKYARSQLGYCRILAIVNEDNEPSIRLLQKLGFQYERMIRLEDETEDIKLFSSEVGQVTGHD